MPGIVSHVAGKIAGDFISFDVVRGSDDVLRVVEIGDGRVSDLVGWTAEAFAAMWARLGI